MTNSYVDILKRELDQRVARNPAYSLRAFAKSLGLTAPHLSAVLNGKKGLSLESANKISGILNFPLEDRTTFCDLVTAKHSRNANDKKAALVRLKNKKNQASFQNINVEEFKLISHWQHFAILHLFELSEFSSSAEWIAERLGLAVPDVVESLNRLELLKLIDRSAKNWKIKNKFTAVQDVPSTAKKNYHHGILQKASRALDEQAREERDFSVVMMSIEKSQMAQARKWMHNFRRKFCSDLDKSKNKDSIYCLGMQFFKISK